MPEEKKEFKKRTPRILEKIGEIKLEPGVPVDDVIFFNGKRQIQLRKINDTEFEILGIGVKSE